MGTRRRAFAGPVLEHFLRSNHRTLVLSPQVLRLLRPGAAIPYVADGLRADVEHLGDGRGSTCQERVRR